MISEYDRIKTLDDIYYVIRDILLNTQLPSKNTKILIKPNFNNDMPSSTGGTTDLRIIICLVLQLKKLGYKDITIGDGPNCGMYYANIDVFHRLGVDSLAKKLKVNLVDFNKDIVIVETKIGNHNFKLTHWIQDCFFINVPKIKTHTEAKLSCCMKNLVGCNVGLNKRTMHWDLNNYIHELNVMFPPDLNIVDGIIVMEGDGPSKGTPKELNLILSGTNSFELDYYISKRTGLKADYLDYALEEGLIKKLAIKKKYHLRPAKPHPIINFMLKNYFVLPRYWKVFSWIFDSEFIGNILTKLNIRQDKLK